MLCLCTDAITLGVVNEQATQTSTSAEKVVAWVADVGTTMQKNQNEKDVDRKHLEDLLKNVPEVTEPDISVWLPFYRAVLLVMTRDEVEFRQVEADLQKSGTLEPELLSYELTFEGALDETSTKKRIAAWDLYGEYIPLSYLGSGRDDRMSPARMIVNPPLPSIPKTSGLSDTLVKVGDLYAKCGLLREATNSYIESIYAESVHKPNPSCAPRWTKIAEWEMEMGQTQLAIRAYLKAAYNDPDSASESSEGITKVLAANAPENKPEGQQPKLDKETALAIAALYCESNLHPLALQVLTQAQKDTDGDFTTQRAEIEKEWTKIVEPHKQVRGDNCVILGAKVIDVKDWAAVHINRPFDTFWKPQPAKDEKPATPSEDAPSPENSATPPASDTGDAQP
jgi:tetratricopeptide (TPR) repeat protein